MNITEYLRLSLPALSIFVNEASDKNATLTTNIQELLTCVYLDYLLNGGKIPNNPEKLWEDVQKYAGKAISEISSLGEKEFNTVVNDRKWLKSFMNQCLSFDNWMHGSNEGKVFASKCTSGCWFVHHDTGWAIKDGQKVNNASIDDRVMNGFAKFKKDINISKKDQYQKADIYAVVPNNDTPKSNMTNDKNEPVNLITDEIDYWCKAFTDPNSTNDLFMGISLKQLNKPVMPEMKNMSSTDEIYDIEDIVVGYNHASNADYGKEVKLGEIKVRSIMPGNVTSTMNFRCNGVDKIFAIRANGLGLDHKLSDFCFQTRMKYTVELRGKGNAAQDGKCRAFISELRKNKDIDIATKKAKTSDVDNMEMDDNKEYMLMSAAEIDKLINDVKKLASQCGVTDVNIDKLSPVEKKIVDYITDNAQTLKNSVLIDEFQDNSVAQYIAQTVKWKMIMCEIFNIYKTIFSAAIANAKKDDVEPDVSLSNLLFNMVMSAKGLNYAGNETHLPFLYLQG